MAQLRSSSRLTSKATESSEKNSTADTKKPKVLKSETKPETDADAAPAQKAAELEVGDQIPDLTLKNQKGEDVNLREIATKSKYLVIFAYPKASTPGCTKQAKGFQSNLKQLKDLDAQVFGLSADSSAAQSKFAERQGLEYPLFADTSSKLIRVLGAKKHPSGTKRSHWIFENGKLKIKKIQISPDVSVNSALADIKALQ